MCMKEREWKRISATDTSGKGTRGNLKILTSGMGIGEEILLENIITETQW